MDSGDGVTHVIPVADGYVIGSCIKHIPLAGRDITAFIQQLLYVLHVLPATPTCSLCSLAHVQINAAHIAMHAHTLVSAVCRRERKEPIPAEDSLEVARRVKEQHCYVCKDIADEFLKYDRDPAKFIRSCQGYTRASGQPYNYEVGYERFIGPEVFFNPGDNHNCLNTANALHAKDLTGSPFVCVLVAEQRSSTLTGRRPCRTWSTT